jgi:AcrR family transcriptional regulator
MKPRAYQLGERQTSVDRNRARIIAGARKLLSLRSGEEGFSVEAVARHAGVARMTVYHQFKSKNGLLEAVYDDLAARGGLPERIGRAFQEDRLMAGLQRLVEAYCHFWAGDRAVIRRLHALADIDPDFSRSDRSGWRRDAIHSLFRRSRGGVRSDLSDLVDMVHTLTSFETYDNLARGSRREHEVAKMLFEVVSTLSR